MPFDNQNFEPRDAALGVLRRLRAFHSDPARWCSAGPGNGYGRCIVAALMEDGTDWSSYDLAKPYLTRALPIGVNSLVHFNERVGTTHAELMAFYDRAIELRLADVMQEVA